MNQPCTQPIDVVSPVTVQKPAEAAVQVPRVTVEPSAVPPISEYPVAQDAAKAVQAPAVVAEAAPVQV